MIITTLLFGILNALRGEGRLQRIGCAALMALLLPGDDQQIIFGLLWLGLCFGWGKYFMVITGEDKRIEREFYPADWLLEKLNIDNNYFYGGAGMAIRWAIGFFPLMLYAYWPNTMQALLYAFLLGIGAGFVYWLAGAVCRLVKQEKWAVRAGEFMAGVLLGAMVCL